MRPAQAAEKVRASSVRTRVFAGMFLAGLGLVLAGPAGTVVVAGGAVTVGAVGVVGLVAIALLVRRS
jgi:hypothetical protein